MRTYYDENKTFREVRLHPYRAGEPGHAGHIDFRRFPEQIPKSLEDFLPYADQSAVQTFYRFLAEVNGHQSHLESSDCALRPPGPHRDGNSTASLSVHGRVCLLFRKLDLNCSPAHTDWLRGRLQTVLEERDDAMSETEGVVGFTLNRALHTSLSTGAWRPDGQFECDADDPGYGRHLMLSFWAYGSTNDETFGNLERIFNNIRYACQAISDEINQSLSRE